MGRKLRCFFGYHEFKVIQTLPPQEAKHIKCIFCDREFVSHPGERTIIPMTKEVEEFYDFINNILNKKDKHDIT